MIWFVPLLLISAYAAPTIPGNEATPVSLEQPPTVTHETESHLDTVTAAAKHAEKPTEVEPIANDTEVELLRHFFLRKQSDTHPVGKVVLANTQLEGSNTWGVSQAQADRACDRIARHHHASAATSLLRSFLRVIIKHQPDEQPPMEGHLLSVGSSAEVLALARLLNPLPKGAYWTGGKLVRHRVKNIQGGGYGHELILTWTDGRIGKASLLGITRLQEEQLQEDYTYCLALDIQDATWQARDCNDQLAYACLLTPKKVAFHNIVANSEPKSIVKKVDEIAANNKMSQLKTTDSAGFLTMTLGDVQHSAAMTTEQVKKIVDQSASTVSDKKVVTESMTSDESTEVGTTLGSEEKGDEEVMTTLSGNESVNEDTAQDEDINSLLSATDSMEKVTEASLLGVEVNTETVQPSTEN